MIRVAASIELAFKSFIFSSAILATCERRMVPAEILPGSAEPDFSFAAFFKRNDAGGGLVVKEKLRSAYTGMTGGTGAPFSRSCVAAVNPLQNSMMWTPRWPSAGPIGGDGLAMPAGTCSLMYPVIFFAMSHFLLSPG